MLRTAVAATDITPRGSVPLEGYGDRTHDSQGIHDPLSARAWYCESPGEPPFVWLALDLCLMSVTAAADLTAALAAATGLAAERIFVSTTHTHSGPSVRFISRDPRLWAVGYYRLLRERLAGLIDDARRAAFSGTIEVRAGASRIGVNRRDVSAPIDPRLVLFSLKDQGGVPRALLFHYSCHLTVLGADNYLVSADWAGPARASLEANLGVPVMFLQGAEGNVDPVSRGFLDMADPDQAAGSSFEVVARLGRAIADDARASSSARPLAEIDHISAGTLAVRLPLRYGPLSPAQVEARLDDWKQRLASFLGIPVERVPEGGAINAMVKEKARTQKLPAGQTRRLVADLYAYGAFLGTYGDGGDPIDPALGTVECPVRWIDCGAVKLLGVPAEVLLEVAFDWQRRFSGSVALVCSLFGGWIGYLPHRSNFEEPRAAELYETVSSAFAPEAADLLLEAAQRQLS